MFRMGPNPQMALAPYLRTNLPQGPMRAPFQMRPVGPFFHGQGGEGAGPNPSGSQFGAAAPGSIANNAGWSVAGSIAPMGVGSLIGLIGNAAQQGLLGPAFQGANLHNADINSAAYGISAEGYSPADFGGSAGGYGGGAEAAGGGYGSDAGGHAGQGSAEGGFSKGGVVPGRGNRDTYRAKLTPGEGVVTKAAMKLHPHVVMMLNALAAAHGRR